MPDETAVFKSPREKNVKISEYLSPDILVSTLGVDAS
jgi:hypothetical protein